MTDHTLEKGLDEARMKLHEVEIYFDYSLLKGSSLNLKIQSSASTVPAAQ